jgi:Lamin Tail Domain
VARDRVPLVRPRQQVGCIVDLVTTPEPPRLLQVAGPETALRVFVRLPESAGLATLLGRHGVLGHSEHDGWIQQLAHPGETPMVQETVRCQGSVALPRRHTARTLAGAATLAFVVAGTVLTSPAIAAAATGSFVFVKAGNVFLSDPQGTKQYQVTKDGTLSNPYLTPTEDSRGNIYAVRENKLFRLAQNGTQVAPPLSLDSGTSRAAVSPDGSRVASQRVVACGLNLCTSTQYRSLPAGASLGLDTSFKEASFAGSTVLGVTAGDVWAHQSGQSMPQQWLIPEVPVGANGAFAATNSVAGTADGIRVVTVDENLETGEAYIFFFTATGIGTAAQLFCGGTLPSGSLTSHASFSPDGGTVIWDGPDGIWTMDLVDLAPTDEACGRNVATSHLLIPAGSSPSWSSAAAAPRPVVKPKIDKSIQIRFVKWDSPGRDKQTKTSLNGEYLKLVNTSKRSKSLSGYTLRDLQGHIYTFPRIVIGPGKSITLSTGPGRNTAKKLHWGLKNHVWDNHKDRAQLRDRYRRVTDSVKWTKAGKGSGTFG